MVSITWTHQHWQLRVGSAYWPILARSTLLGILSLCLECGGTVAPATTTLASTQPETDTIIRPESKILPDTCVHFLPLVVAASQFAGTIPSSYLAGVMVWYGAMPR